MAIVEIVLQRYNFFSSERKNVSIHFDTQTIHTDNQDIIKIAIHERYTNDTQTIHE
jgi:hypothetical protein